MAARVKKKEPRQPIRRERALALAVELADTSGLDGVTMRQLAEQLGVQAMSLYHHFPNKDAILDGMVDLVFREVELPREPDWRDAMRGRAASMRSALRRHPWALRVMESRTAPGPATLAHHDAVIGCLREAGFSLELTAHAYALLDSYIYGFAHTELNLPFQTTEEAHELVGAMLERMPSGTYPNLVELATHHVMKPSYSYASEFEFGLELILDGLERARHLASDP